MLAIIRDGVVTNLVEGDEGAVDIVQSYTVGIVTFVPEVSVEDDEEQQYVSIGCSYIEGKFIPPTPPEIAEVSDEQIASAMRIRRDSLLLQSDIKMLYDNWNSMSDELKAEWTAYRESLRNIPEQDGFPREIVWPTEPNSNPVGIAST